MATKKMQLETWRKRVDAEGAHGQLFGDSPGGVANKLGCSRQFVHSLIKRGHLDTVDLYEGDRLVVRMVTADSLKLYRQRSIDQAKARIARLA
jgi:hypothetical protein